MFNQAIFEHAEMVITQATVNEAITHAANCILTFEYNAFGSEEATHRYYNHSNGEKQQYTVCVHGRTSLLCLDCE